MARRSSRRQLVMAGATVLALGLAVGVGAWRVGMHHHNGTIATQVQPQSQPQGGSQANDLPATSSVPTAASIPSLYLVGSTEQANDVQQVLDWAAIAWQPLEASVQVVPPGVSAAEVAETVNEARSMEGLVPMTVEDLRTPDASAVPPQSPPSYPDPDVVPYSGIC
jgi:hypothetical protein